MSRLQAGTAVYDALGERASIPRLLADARLEDEGMADIPILLGARHRLRVRLIAQEVPEGVTEERRGKLEADAKRRGQKVSANRIEWAQWTIYVTNAPRELLSAREALVLARARWQIEQLFRLWKSQALIDESVSAKPYRRLCELYAKLIGVVVQHWLFLVGRWSHPDRSLGKMARVVRSHAMTLAAAVASGTVEVLIGTIRLVGQVLRAGGCKMEKRKHHPRTFQLLLDPDSLP